MAGASKLRMTSKQLEQCFRDAEAAYPEECCGILYGRLGEDGSKEVQSAEPIRNEFEETERFHRFEIPAEVMLRAELKARQEKLDIVGFYHSHPDCEAIPSEYDRTHALPVYSYLIVSCKKGKAGDERNWVIDTNTQSFVEEGLDLWQ